MADRNKDRNAKDLAKDQPVSGRQHQGRRGTSETGARNNGGHTERSADKQKKTSTAVAANRFLMPF